MLKDYMVKYKVIINTRHILILSSWKHINDMYVISHNIVGPY